MIFSGKTKINSQFYIEKTLGLFVSSLLSLIPFTKEIMEARAPPTEFGTAPFGVRSPFACLPLMSLFGINNIFRIQYQISTH